MTDRTTRPGEEDSAGGSDAASRSPRAEPAVADGVAATDAYEAEDGGVVLYDIENPLAWVEADLAVTVERMA